MRNLFIIIATVFLFTQNLFAQPQSGGGTCATAAPICTDYAYDFPLQTNTDSETGPYYDCLLSQPNPAWYYFEIATAGNLGLDLHAGNDVDFIIWGPFNGVTCNSSDLSSGNVVDCSYETWSQEWPMITNAQVGETYMMLITNYANVSQNFSLTQSSGSGATDCSIVNPQCSVDAGPDQSVCLGSFTNLQATASVIDVIGGYTFIWSPTGTIINDSTINVQANNASQTYTVTLNTADGCTATDDVTIITQNLNTPNISVTNEQCGYINGTANVTMTNGVAPYNYNIVSQINTTGNFSNLSANTYNITVTDNSGCTVSSQFTIVDDGSVTAAFTPPASQCLQGNSFSFDATASTIENTPTYTWDFGDGNSGSGVTTTHSYTNANTYTVELTITDGTCSNSTTNSFSVNTSPTPDITGVLTICAGMSTTLDAGAGYANYSWNPAGSSQITTASIAGNYSVTVTDANGCTGSDMVTVVESSSLSPNITGTLSICSGNSTVLDAGAGYTNYIWSPLGNTQTINVTTAGDYAVTVTDANGCTGTDQVTVDVQSVSTNITGILGICEGASTTLNAGAGFANYIWSNGSTAQTISVDLEGTYSVTVSNALGCTDTETVNISVDYLNLVASSDKVICIGGTAELAAALSSGGIAPFNYYWSTGETTSNISVSPTTETTYSVYLIDAFGCQSNSENITVTISPDVNFNIYANKDSICPGDPVLISANPTSGVPPYSITDSQGNLVSLNNTVYPYQQETYTYTVTDACGSTATDMVTINTFLVPPLNIQADVLYGCEPLAVNFIVPESNDDYIYSWSFSNNNNSEAANGASTYHIFENYGIYDVMVSAISNKGCKNSLVISNLINVYRKPEAHFLANPQTVSIINPEINFLNLSQWADYYLWSFGDGDSSNITNPNHSYNDIDSYTVKLLASTLEGCIDTVFQQITVEIEPTIYVPTAFSPDNDGINDFFEIKANGMDLDNFNVKVYDRWGEIIFESSDLYKSWNGKAKNNLKFVKIGSYTWLVTVKDANGIELQKSGTVTVIR